ncbi:winged helix-turn-helix domain-containing protein, partial [Vibrio sp.]|nr:winged helix-turn-helix domain-containing protein [Vibrio sp.]
RDDLIKNVWDHPFISDQSVTQAIFLLRKLLTPSKKENQNIIQTVTKKGYKFTCEVSHHIDDVQEIELDNDVVNFSDAGQSDNITYDHKSNDNVKTIGYGVKGRLEKIDFKFTLLLTLLSIFIVSLYYIVYVKPNVNNNNDIISQETLVDNEHQCNDENNLVSVHVYPSLYKNENAIIALHEALYLIGRKTNCRFIFKNKGNNSKLSDYYVNFRSEGEGMRIEVYDQDNDNAILSRFMPTVSTNDAKEVSDILQMALSNKLGL